MTTEFVSEISVGQFIDLSILHSRIDGDTSIYINGVLTTTFQTVAMNDGMYLPNIVDVIRQYDSALGKTINYPMPLLFVEHIAIFYRELDESELSNITMHAVGEVITLPDYSDVVLDLESMSNDDDSTVYPPPVTPTPTPNLTPVPSPAFDPNSVTYGSPYSSVYTNFSSSYEQVMVS